MTVPPDDRANTPDGKHREVGINYPTGMLTANDKELRRSWLDVTLARFEADNAASLPWTRSLLERILADPDLHARLINTLSLLEHMGSHKIMATRHSATIDRATLKHVAEEAHHAFFMKRQAEKCAGRELSYVPQDLLAPASARMYFQRLEALIVRLLESQRDSQAAYLYMSMIVEFRALWFYRLYEQCLKRAGYAMSLKRLIGEERHHLNDMAQRLELAGDLDDARAHRFLDEERRLYLSLLGALERAAA